MATFQKKSLKSGFSYQAKIYINKKPITKTFKSKKLARKWAIAMEADQEALKAVAGEFWVFTTLADGKTAINTK